MKKIILFATVCFCILCSFTSCITTAQAYDYPYSNGNNVIVVGDTCYVYYQNPTNDFLNTLRVIDGYYFYWSINRYIPVVFPYWDAWSPYRYFYHNSNRWMWRDRVHYNHFNYRQNHRWMDYRRPPQNRYNRPPMRPNNNFNRGGKFTPQRRATQPRNHNYNRGSFNNRPHPRGSSTRVTVNRGHFGGRR